MYQKTFPYHYWLPLVLLCLWLLTPTSLLAKETAIVGRIEYGILLPENIKLKVKMDTGATMSSLHAVNIQRYTKADQPWVKFVVKLDDDKEFTFDRKIIGEIGIKKRHAEIANGQTHEIRPVVMMDLCLNGKVENIQVNLADRSHFTYPMLLGRISMEQFGILIDPTDSFITKPNCQLSSNDRQPILLLNHR